MSWEEEWINILFPTWSGGALLKRAEATGRTLLVSANLGSKKMAGQKFEDYQGELVKHQGDELIYLCRKCHKPKLSLNINTGLWHCFVCDAGGKSVEGWIYNGPQQINTKALDQEFDEQIDAARLAVTEGAYRPKRMQDFNTINAFRCFGLANDRVSMPLYSKRKVVGLVKFSEHANPRYCNYGARGIAFSAHREERLDLPNHFYKHLLLFEGLFDGTSVYTMLHQQYPDFPLLVGILAGNVLSNEQLATILTSVPVGTKIHLAFDNDRMSAVAKAYNKIRVHRPVSIATPPEDWGKDWYDAVDRRCDLSMKFWGERLGLQS